MFSTKDFYITAVLLTKGFEIKSIDTEGFNKKIKRFAFDDTPELQEVVRMYTNARLEGNLKDFKNAIETVKELCHQ